MYNIIQKLVEKIGSYNQLLKNFDKNYGYFPDELTEWIKNEIIANRTNADDTDITCLYEMRNIKTDADAILLHYIFNTVEQPNILQNENIQHDKYIKSDIISEYKKKYRVQEKQPLITS